MDSFDVNKTIYSLIGMGIGTILGGGIALINTYLTNRANIRLEKLKMHEGPRIEAYKNLLHFSERIFGDPTDDMSTGFLLTMKADFYKKIFPNYLYYPKKIRELLDELKNQYDCWGHPDFFDEKEADKFLGRLNTIARELQDLSIKEADL
jgi:hypothetical protein